MEIHWQLVFYTLLGGLGAGAFAFVSLTELLGKAERSRMPGAITVLVSLVLAGVAALLHLGNPERVFNVVGNLGSGIGVELILSALLGIAVVVYILMLWRGASAGARKALAAVGLVLAAVMAILLGATYVMPARPAWNTWLLPILFAASAAVLGIFAMYLWTAMHGGEESPLVKGVNQSALIALVVQAVILVAYVVYLALAPEVPVARLLAGDLAVAFWVGMVLVGLVVPLVLTIWPLAAKRGALPPVGVAAAGLISVLVGGIATRALLYLLASRVALLL